MTYHNGYRLRLECLCSKYLPETFIQEIEAVSTIKSAQAIGKPFIVKAERSVPLSPIFRLLLPRAAAVETSTSVVPTPVL